MFEGHSTDYQAPKLLREMVEDGIAILKLISHGKLAQELGVPKENVFIGTNGQVFEFAQDNAGVTGKLAGKVTSGKVFVDGLGVGDVGNVVLRDRQLLSQDGVLIVVVTMDKGSGRL